MVSDYRRKEGTSAGYVFALIVPFALTSLLAVLLTVRLPGVTRRFATELIVLVYSAIFNVTVFSDSILRVLGVLIASTTLFVLLKLREWSAVRDVEQDPSAHEEHFWRRLALQARQLEMPLKRPGYLTMCRSTVLLITVVCILAVDFPIFPRYSFKTHKYGFSLMDVGIGLFVCIIAVVSSKPNTGHYKLSRNWLRLLWNVFPFVALGIGRSVIIKLIHYHQGVTEYGEHWNSFLTLAFTKFFATILASIVPSSHHMLYLSIVVLGLHETGLQYGVADFVMDRRVLRDNFLRANREGIVSIPGFVALYLATMYMGDLLRSANESDTAKDLGKRIIRFAFISISLWIAVFQMDSWLGVSRRIFSAGYVAWMLCIFATMTTIYMIIELFGAMMALYKNKERSWSYIPLIMQSINYNGLPFFLLANVLTGIVNMSIETSEVNTLVSLIIMMVYMFVNCFVVTFFYVKRIRIKFW